MISSVAGIFTSRLRRSGRLPPLLNHRLFSTSTPPSSDEVEGGLRTRIFDLHLPKHSATAAVDKWVSDGNSVTASQLRRISVDLKRCQRYKHALEISEWMKNHHECELSDRDYAMRIDLIAKVFGVSSAQEYFEGLPSTAKSCEVYTALLHSYAGSKMTENAESLFEKIKESDIGLTALICNEMMTLYVSIGQLDKVPLIVDELKRRKVSPDLFTYNLWISACAATQDLRMVRQILDDMANEFNPDNGWKTYMKLANIYITACHPVESQNSLVDVNATGMRELITYDFLVLLQAGLGNTEKISEIWKSLLMVKKKVSDRNYICVLSTYLVLGLFNEAEDIVDEWKQSKGLHFDVSACKRLLDALLSIGLADTADFFCKLMLRKNCEL